MNVSDYAALQRDAFRVKTGVAVAANDLLELGPDGKAYPVKCTDYAAVANCRYGTPQTTAANGMIVAPTQISPHATPAYHRQALLISTDGSIYTTTYATGGIGILLTKYSASGALIGQVTAASVGSYSNYQSFFLSDGNICVTTAVSGGSTAFAIYDTLLNPIKTVTNLAENSSTSNFSACALQGGGFAVIYQNSAAPLESRFVSYSNTGSVVTAPLTVWTRTGTTATQYHRIAQLSDGNLVVAAHSSNTVASIGLFYAVLAPTGAIVKAFASLNSSPGANYAPEISVMQGRFAIAKGMTANLEAYIFDNTGTLQGSGFASDTSSVTSLGKLKLLNDGSQFWLLYSRYSDNAMCLTKLPATGTAYVTTVVTTAESQYGTCIDAFAENGLIVAVSSLASSTCRMWVISTATGLLLSSLGTGFGATTTSASTMLRVLPVGDFAFACMYEFNSPASTSLFVGKYASTAVLGCANTNAEANTLVPASQKASAYAVNYIKGSPSKPFDHSAADIIGNKGVIMNYGAVLKGI